MSMDVRMDAMMVELEQYVRGKITRDPNDVDFLRETLSTLKKKKNQTLLIK